MKKIIDCTTGEETEVELTAKDEKQQVVDEKVIADLLVKKAEQESKKQAVWDKLGLSADEVSALLA